MLYPYLNVRVKDSGVSWYALALLGGLAVFLMWYGSLWLRLGENSSNVPDLSTWRPTVETVRTLQPTQMARVREGEIPGFIYPTATPDVAEQIQATQTQWWQSYALPTPVPTSTRMPGECYVGDSDPCWQAYAEAGANPEQYWNLWTPQVATAIPTLRTFVTWTPTPDVSTFEREIQATIHVMAEATALALTPTAQAEERTRDDFEERGVPQAARE